MINPGMIFLLGPPSLFRLNHIPTNPPHHHTIPMVVCCTSFPTHAFPQRCSVNVLTTPQAAMTEESKNSWDRPVRLSHSWPTRRTMVKMIPYAMKALPMMKWAKHWPRWSARQNPKAVIPPNSICIQLVMGNIFPTIPWQNTTYFLILPLIPRLRWSLR